MSGGGDPESGTTLTEVLVVLTITTVLALPLLAVVTSTVRFQDRNLAEEQARVEVEQVLAAMADDLRTGAPVARRLRGTTAADAITVEVADGTATGALIYWAVDARGLRRTEADASTRRVRRRSRISRTVVRGDDPIFRYFDAKGVELDPTVLGLERLTECTALVEVRLSVPIEDDPDDRMITGTARHAVRTRAPGANRC